MISNPMVAPKKSEVGRTAYNNISNDPMVSIVILETTCLGMFHVC